MYIATASIIDGTIAQQQCKAGDGNPRNIQTEHPAGQIDVRLETSGDGAKTDGLSAGVLRTVRLIIRGEVLVKYF